jgi:hypothetical protein
MIEGIRQNICSASAKPQPLAWFRIGLAAVLLVQAVSQIGHLDDLYGRHGIVGWSVNSADLTPGVPNLAWLEPVLSILGLPPGIGLYVAYAIYVVGLFGLLLGYRTRIAAVVAWIAHTALLTSGEMSLYGVDRFAQIGLFYCVWFPVGHALSLDKVTTRVRGEPSFEAWLGIRMLQVHICIAYTATGVEKALGEQWWNGEAIWLAVMCWSNDFVDGSFLANAPWFAQPLGWMTLLLEAGVLLFIWHPRTRQVWLVGVVGMHLGIALLMNLWTFSAVMIVFDVAAFGVPARARVKTTVFPSLTKVESSCRSGQTLGRRAVLETASH